VVIGTFGRGVWTLSNPGAALNPGTISGAVYNDANDNGVLDPGEASLGGWTVFIDPDNDGHLATGDPKATTDASGNYRFTGLIAGTYNIYMVPWTGWRESASAVDAVLAEGLIPSSRSAPTRRVPCSTPRSEL
jgi:hypothetical protein